MIKQCEQCFICYDAYGSKQKFCTNTCFHLSTRLEYRWKEKVCAVCLENFVPSYRRQKCCSRECAKIKETVTKNKGSILTKKERRNILERNAAKNDPKFKLNRNMRRSIHHSLNGTKNYRKWKELIGYGVDELKLHLEKQFQPGMSWENYGEWHIDHDIPISAFNFTKPEHEDFKRCWALKNLRPLWANENQIKHAKLSKHFQPKLMIG